MEKEESLVGVCTRCGIAVTGENLGRRDNGVLCRKCLTLEEIKSNGEKAASKRQKEAICADLKAKFRLKTVLFGCLGAVAGIAGLVGALSNGYYLGIPLALLAGYAIFAFLFCVFNDSAVTAVVVFMGNRSIRWPALLFTLDVDGILWFICVKLLFAVLGFLFGIFLALLGVVLGMALSVFLFPFTLHAVVREYKTGVLRESCIY